MGRCCWAVACSSAVGQDTEDLRKGQRQHTTPGPCARQRPRLWPTLVGETKGTETRPGLLLLRVDLKCQVRARVHAQVVHTQVSSVWASGSGVHVVPPALEAALQELMWRRHCLGDWVDPRGQAVMDTGSGKDRLWPGARPHRCAVLPNPALRGHSDTTLTGTPAVSVQQRRENSTGQRPERGRWQSQASRHSCPALRISTAVGSGQRPDESRDSCRQVSEGPHH